MTDFGGEGLSDKSSARVLQVYVSNNLTWDEGSQGTVNYTTHIGDFLWCDSWRKQQHVLYQMANAVFFMSYVAPSSTHGVIFMHASLIIGFALFSFWAWNVICAPDVFSWNFSFMFLNLAQLVYIIYQMRPVKFDPELEEAYQALFYPFKVSRLQFKKMVSIIAATACRYLYWQRSALEYLFVKETYIATVLTTLIARDITTKLYAMNKKIVTEKGSHLDIRLPSITTTLTSAGEYKSPSRTLRSSMLGPDACLLSSDSVFHSQERSVSRETGGILSNGRLQEMDNMTELLSNDDLISNNGVESWLETSSKYHSCEVVDN